MNAMDKNREWLDNDVRFDDARFDRLVDGELTPAEYQSLVAGLDDEPGGWRRCALAFLEAQALGGELAAICRSGQLNEQVAAPVTVVIRKPVSLARWKLLLAMSASFLVAFILGVTVPSLWQPGGRSGGGGDGNLAALSGEVPAGIATPQASVRTVGNARLLIDGPGGTQSSAGEVPIYEVSADARDTWLTQQEPVLPVNLIEELKRRGHHVERVEQYVPVNLEDGREGVIPVESYQITPVSRWAY